MNRLKRSLSYAVLMGAASIGTGVQAATIGLEDTPGAQSVLYSGSELIEGTGANAVALNLTGPGELFLTLTDLDFPNPFASLQFALSDAQTALIAPTPAGTAEFTVTSPTTLYADVYAATQTSGDIGLYNLTATFVSTAPVPLPSAAELLGSVALPGIALSLLCIRRARTTVTTAVA